MSQARQTSHWDAIVVGARCAGSATALLLARAGCRVLVLEAGRPGADTLSTHALMRGGVIQLHRWGLLDEVVAAGTPAITRTDFQYGMQTRESVEIRSGAAAPALYAPRRMILDAILTGAAARAGATVWHGAKVTGLLRDGGRVTGLRWVDRTTGTVHAAHASLVIGADGRRSTVAELVGAPHRQTGSSSGAVLLGYWPGLERHAYQWFYVEGGSAGVVPTNDGLACVWAGMPAAQFATATQRPDVALQELLAHAAPGLQLYPNERRGPVRGFAGFPGFVRRSSGPGWALVGDAGYFKDPITAHGMTDALRDAELLARAVISSSDTDGGRSAALGEYESIRDELSAPLRDLTERIASYQWDLSELRELLAALSRAMRPEVRALLELDEQHATEAA